MPYPKEHSCRLEDPAKFQEGSFRRTQREHEGKKYAVIIGKKEGEDTMTDQAFRYEKKTWDPDEARRHCRDHNGSFEPAGDGASLETMTPTANDSTAYWAASKQMESGCEMVGYEQAWAIMPGILPLSMEGEKQEPQAVADMIETAYGIAVIPVSGIITQGGIMGTGTERLAQAIEIAAADSGVNTIILNIDSPGGSVYGVPEAGARIRRVGKPVIAIVNSLATSAAYWLASQADMIAMTPSGETGSIGIIAVHVDLSRLLDKLGITVTYIHAGRYKVEANPDQSLNEEARCAIQMRVDEYYGMFVRDVAAGRGRSVISVKTEFGEGRVFGAREALQRGMIDRIVSMNDLIAEMQSFARRNMNKARARVEALRYG